MVRPYLFPSQKYSAEGRRRSARMAAPGSLGLLQVPPFTAAKCQSVPNRSAARRAPRALFGIRASAADAATKDAVLKAFREKRALKIISGLQNFDRGSVASVITAADKEGWCGSIGSVEEMQAKLLKRQEAATKLGLNSLTIYIAVQDKDLVVFFGARRQ